MIKLVLFDFDGTLVDTANDIVLSVHQLLEYRNYPTLSKEEIISNIGEGFIGLLRDQFPEMESDLQFFNQLQDDFYSFYDKNLLNNPVLFPGVKNFLSQWPHKIGILSNKTEKHIPLVMEKLDLLNHPWETIIGGDSYEQKKPHPMPMEKALSIANVSPSETLLVGDGIPDVGVALASGVHFVGVDFGYSSKEVLQNHGAKEFISHHDELSAHIDKINATC
jgi:phosphoglycolate phosphatase